MNRLYTTLSRTRLRPRHLGLRLVGVAGLFLALPALAQYRSYPLPAPNNDVIGQLLQYPAQQEDTLLDIARRFSLGQDEIVQANPQVDKWLPGKGTPVLLPTQFILPRGNRQGIIINVPEMRLYYFPPASKGLGQQVITYPVSIGRMDWDTPVGMTRVLRKDKDPVWYPPASIKKEHAEKGDILPDVVPAGPDNPLGQHAMRLGFNGYLIHGTNNPWGIGMRVTHGCVRMYPEDVAQLFDWVDVGTPVEILNDPVKVGWLGDALYLEVHEPLEESNASPERLYEMAMQAVLGAVAQRPVRISWARVREIVTQQNGVPTAISLDNRQAPSGTVQMTPSPTQLN
ncbi:MAG: L,D-transpeptidase family protein [Pseudomonadota bacterium]